MALLDNMFDLTGKAAVVTGGGSGIGEATSLVLAEAGAAVVVADINAEAAEATAKQIVAQGGKAVALRTDVQRRADHDAAVDRAVAEFGSADIYCNIAGIPCDVLVSEISEADLDRMIGINLKGVLFGCQAAMRVHEGAGDGRQHRQRVEHRHRHHRARQRHLRDDQGRRRDAVDVPRHRGRPVRDPRERDRARRDGDRVQRRVTSTTPTATSTRRSGSSSSRACDRRARCTWSVRRSTRRC